MRRARWGASVALTAVLALVAVPGSAGSRSPGVDPVIAQSQFRAIMLVGSAATVAATLDDPAQRSASALAEDTVLRDPAADQSVASRTQVAAPAPKPGSIDLNPWRRDSNVSWYGPGFYGNRTACGYTLTRTLIGVANRTLPCGTRVIFRNPANGRSVIAMVVDRGPYVGGRQWDMTGGLCTALGHCYTGAMDWKFAY